MGLYKVHETLTPDNCHEALHDAQELKENIFQCFVHGDLTFQRTRLCGTSLPPSDRKDPPGGLKASRIFLKSSKTSTNILLDTYFCNFSVFQSLPDFWAVDQLFPVMPIHSLNEEPTRKGIIGDLSCDSDGKIDQFVQQARGTTNTSSNCTNPKDSHITWEYSS